jgi:1-acyl-sn-glycerol-3-phosphate acyltransferase
VWKLRSILISAPGVIIATTLMATISLICSTFDKGGRIQHRLAQQWSRMLLAVAFSRCEVFGLEKLKPGASYVVVANHSSYMDTPVVLSSLPLDIRFFAKKSLFSIPFLGWHLQRSGHLEVARGDARASLKSMLDGARLIRERSVSVLLFPEGGRSEKGLRPFIEGAAFIAIKAGIPVVPVGLVNTRGVLPMHSALLRPGRIEVHIGDPIETTGMTPKDRGRLNQMLYEQVATMIGEPVHAPVTNPA